MPESPHPPIPPPAGDPPPVLPSAHGSKLVSALRTGASGERTAACPVCLATTAAPGADRGWSNVRCDSCGCEFIASNGSLPPPPPPPPPVPKPEPTVKVAGSRILSLILIGDGGRRVVRCPTCHAIEPVVLAGSRVDVRCTSCGTEFIASTSLVAPPPPPPRPAPHRAGVAAPPAATAPPPPSPAAVVVADAIRTAPDGSRSVICPLCRKFSVALPRVLPTFTIRVTCPGCRAPFTVDLRRARPRLPPAADRVRPPPRQTPKWAVFALITLSAGIAGYLLWHVLSAALWFRNFGE
jgi:ribosomal protein S27E